MSSPLVNSPSRGIDIAHVHFDLGNMGRIKAPPVCIDAALKQEAMSTEELAKFSFPLEANAKQSLSTTSPEPHHAPSVVSSSSSTASRESALSDIEGNNKMFSTPRLERRQSSQINMKVTSQKTSRNGRQTQRWHTDPDSKRVYRMVAGCVPIVEGGGVLFVSASRKAEWIIPKGGWENDEALEEGAIRECFEEAGVLGVLGPRLKNIDYETRKAKKRRLEFEEKTKVCADKVPVESCSEGDGAVCTERHQKPVACNEQSQILPDHVSTKKRGLPPPKPNQSDETSSVASDSSLSHTHVRLSLFVLYVSEVKDSWPESGRKRKVVDIDEAIRMCESRPEFLAALKEVKERNLHHLPENERGGGTGTTSER